VCLEVSNKRCKRKSNRVFMKMIRPGIGKTKLWVTSVRRGFIAVFRSRNETVSTRVSEKSYYIRMVENLLNSSIYQGVEKILNGFKVFPLSLSSSLCLIGSIF
jgi:hypothetical protein